MCRLEDEIINAKISTSNPVKENYNYHDSKLPARRNPARKMFQTYHDPVLKRKLNKLNKQINKLDPKIETDAFTNELLNVNVTDGKVWKFVTPLKRKLKTFHHLMDRQVEKSTVVPILKPRKDSTNTTSYRPISLLPSLSNIAEHLILNRLNNYLKENKVICPEEFGFREKLSTSYQLIRVVEYVTEAFANKQKTGAAYLDIQKVFDRFLARLTYPQTYTLQDPLLPY
ncbi:hypothetical protein AVEN_173831-1 [Araneus ventricosus]|uniref:Reverse transcriptase domain-containing protein n=1 Tax=Araneus ventricosus TaxID=182803 RepID=A0A4Y2SS82_ARAVE|nr:hypothetical protein AVEN_173831-1 [Araneus ventricosus]